MVRESVNFICRIIVINKCMGLFIKKIFYNLYKVNCIELKKLNLNIQEINYKKEGYILLCTQLPWDTQVQDINYRFLGDKKWQVIILITKPSGIQKIVKKS